LDKSGLRGSEYALIARLTGVIVAFAVGTWWLYRSLPDEVSKAKGSVDGKEMFSVALPLMFVASMQVVLGKLDVIMLGYLGSLEAVGLYNVAVQLAALASFGLVAINMIAAPMISSYHADGNMGAIQRTVSLTALGGTAFGVLTIIIFSIFGHQILLAFGTSYTGSSFALWILFVGPIGSAIAGPVGWILSMTGEQVTISRVLLVAAAADGILNLILIPLWGMNGAALSTMLVTIGSNVAMVFFVQRKMGINPTCFTLSIVSNNRN